MMIKKISFTLLCIFLNFSSSLANSNIFIFATVDNEIITNLDIKKESEYLKILNPNLEQLDNEKILDLAKNSLIKEIVKKKEISKSINPKNDNPYVESQLKTFYTKLNYKNEEEFKSLLKERNNYSLDEIKQKIKIELFWNELIYKKYNKQIKIDKNKLKKKIDNLNNDSKKQYLLSEIVFTKKKDGTIEELIDQIKLSINDIGFDNTANIYSISETANLGGKIGLVNESSLSKNILSELNQTGEGSYTNVIQVGNNFMLLKIDQIKITEIKVDKKKEFEKLIQYETNKQLNQFSRIFFDKSQMNYTIDEK